MQDTVSVIIPAHNAEAYLGQALDSIRSSLHPAHEIIVVDDGSTDGTASIASKYPEVRYHHQSQSGPTAARRAGCELATGGWLAFLDADDTWAPGRLSSQLALMTREPEWDGCFGQVEHFISPELNDTEKASIWLPASQEGWLPSALLLKRASYQRAGPFESEHSLGEFIDWVLRAQESGCRFTAVKEVVVHRRLHLTNMGRTQRSSREDYLKIVAAALKRRRRLAAESPPG